MARSEAQRAADKKYRETHKGNLITWNTAFKPNEAAEIDAVISASGLTRAEFIRQAVAEYKQKHNL